MPGLGTRGGYGVVGLCVADLFVEPPGQESDELIVTTIAGDVLVFNANSLGQLLWRSHVPGSAGFFNSIRVVNTNPTSDNLKELYIAGSFGLWRFTEAGESSQP